jgi:hypothetical protein
MNFERIISAHNALISRLLRLMAGSVPLHDGVGKYLFSDKPGSGRFERDDFGLGTILSSAYPLLFPVDALILSAVCFSTGINYAR